MMSDNRKHRSRVLFWTLASAVALAGVAGLVLLARNAGGNGPDRRDKKKGAQEEAPPAPVELTQVRQGGISTYLSTTTTLEAQNTAVLIARREGQITSLPAEEGQWVTKGQVLAQLDETEARLAMARAELEESAARREVERAEQMNSQAFMSAKERDDLQLRLKKAVVELEQARYDLTQTRITAPYSGRITSRMIQLGETLTEGRECFRILDFDPVLARLYFPERELHRVREGQEAVLNVDAHPGREFAARVSLVNPVVDPANGTFKVTLEIPNPTGELRPGSFARARLKTGDFTAALLLPRRGILTEDGENYVFVAQGDSAVKVSISLGAVEGDTAQVLAGLTASDMVVTIGQGGLKTGMKIKAVTF
jgi:membrane fusion protein (multidrug efflux system)